MSACHCQFAKPIFAKFGNPPVTSGVNRLVGVFVVVLLVFKSFIFNAL